ncbi:MAG TPA: glycoside hydrolase domain-containing protein [Planctomycetota bacterium]|jgi:hypothetical protein
MRHLCLAFFISACACAAQDIKLLDDFEQDAEIKAWDFHKESKPALSDQHVTHGQKCLKLAANGGYMSSWRLPKDWSGYDSLEVDMFNDGSEPVAGSTLIADQDWQAKGGTYWNRHNGGFTLKPGANTVSIPVNGLYRGEAGSRGNDLKTNINPKAIIRVDFGFRTKQEGASVFVDYMRLVKESRPEGIQAFDFGPPSQVLFPGFTPITWNTVFGVAPASVPAGRDAGATATAGLRRAKWGPNAARDDTFPTRLYQDFVEMTGEEFVVGVPDGKYHVWVVFDDLGYWGGEQARFTKRSIENAGKTVWSEERSPDDYLFHFENVEPKPGDSMWDLYMKYLFEPKRFDATSTGGQLALRFKAEGVLAGKVAAIIVYPDAKKAECEKWVTEIEARNRKEFEARAVYMGSKREPVKGSADGSTRLIVKDVPESSWDYGVERLESDIDFKNGLTRSDRSLRRFGARGQRVSFTFAVQVISVLDEPGACELASTDLKSADGTIPASEVDLRYVHHSTKRGFNDIAYSIQPESLRPIKGGESRILTPPDGSWFTRQFWITVHVPADAKPGMFSGKVTLRKGKKALDVPLTLDVLDLTLDEPDFLMGFYGFGVPAGIPEARKKTAMRELFTILKQNGMNCISGGPGIQFSGFDAAGKPQLDFAACDEYFKIAKECGFTKEFNSYGGPAMVHGLHDGYVIGETGHGWEKKTGKPFGELLKIVWSAVKEHAEKEGWPPVAYGFTDEPRVIEAAREQVELMKAYRDNVPFVKIGGSYSVQWNNDPLEKEIQNIFKTLVWSALNSHTQTDLDKAKELGKELYIYNQGTSRYSFGAYQWAEFRKGVRGRIQWHLLALHGYQFFDLDGREPDTAMINWGKNEIIPTIHLARCREGADDFRFAVTLWNMAQKKKDTPEGKAAIAWLEDVSAKIGINQSKRPDGFMDDETFRNTCVEHIKKLK